MLYYSGIGSRETPPIVCKIMTKTAAALNMAGYVLRSGGAFGADQAFERGAGVNKDIYLPWEGFEGNTSTLYPASSEAYDMARSIHPKWKRLGEKGKQLHARNCHQILGSDLKSPSDFVICWTVGGEKVGGTATAIKIAENHDIYVLNLGVYTDNKVVDAINRFMIPFNLEIKD